MKLQPFQKRTRANIGLDAAECNYHVIRVRLDGVIKLCCVVKANGYGYGAVECLRSYEIFGADYLAASNIEEAIQLRNVQISLLILILGYTDLRCADELMKYHIT